MAEIEVPFDVLRRAVESAHGHTGDSMHLCVVKEKGESTIMLLTDANLALIPVDDVTPILRTSKSRIGIKTAGDADATVTIQVKGATAPKVFPPKTADSLFWTESAIEKFFFPYYQRVLPPDEFAELQRRYYHPKPDEKPILAFVHYPPSIYDGSLSLLTKPTNLGNPETGTFGIITL